MNNPEELLFTDARKALLREVKSLAGRGNLDEAFAAWLLPEPDIGLQLKEAAQAAKERTGGQRSYRDVAVLGFAAAAGVLEVSLQDALKAGLTWVAGREPFIDGMPMDFCLDTVALLGIALGAEFISEDATKDKVVGWMKSFIGQSCQNRLEDWQKCLLAAVLRMVDSNATLSIPNAIAVADVRVVLRAKGLFPTDDSSIYEQTEALLLIKREAGIAFTPARAALRIAAFDSIRQTSPAVNLNSPSVQDVCRMLHRVPVALEKWMWQEKPHTREGQAQRWYIENEYHVQNILYLLLAPIFPHLREVDYTPSQTALGIPNLRLIIAVKYISSTDTIQDVIEQISSDLRLYLKDSSSSSIIVFVWDNYRRLEQHEWLRSSLRQIESVVDAVVGSYPGSIERVLEQQYRIKLEDRNDEVISQFSHLLNELTQARFEDKDKLINQLWDLVSELKDKLAPSKVSNYFLPNSQFAGGMVDATTVQSDRIGGDIHNSNTSEKPD